LTVESWIIGTAADCPMRVQDEYASAHHAQIFRDRSGQVWIRDLGSTNGTYVRHPDQPSLTGDYLQDMLGDTKVPLGSVARVEPGDSVRVGRTWIPWRVA
jgi:pSer/pThr/pTyr-binding forkhead associated (FHA) protein